MFLRGNLLVLAASLAMGCSGRLVSTVDSQVDADVALDADRGDAIGATPDTLSNDVFAIDPGRPSSEFGPRCAIELTDETTNAKITFDSCTASAVSNGETTHLFLLINRLPAAAQRMYTSLVLGTAPLVPGQYTSARAGSIETTLGDGRIFTAGNVKSDGSFKLAVERVAPGMLDPDVLLVTATLEATLVDVANPSFKQRLRAGTN